MGVLRDCERILDSLLGQPVNTLTAFGFIVAGGWVISRSTLRWVGIALIATGVGSILFHGPMPPFAEWAHDVSLAWLILVIAGAGRSWDRWTHLPGLAVLSGLFALAPGSANPVAVALTVIAVVLLLQLDRSRATLGPLVLLGTVAVIGRLGATGGPLCDPDSLLQPHALWHIGSATAVVWWAVGRYKRE